MRQIVLVFSVAFYLSAFGADRLDRLETTEEHRYLLGLGIQFLVPDQLPDFESTQIVYSPRVFIPIGQDHIQIGVSYGSDTGVYPQIEHIFLAEIDYRLDYKTRFFTGFISVGGQYSRYLSRNVDHQDVGPNMGFGLIFPLAKDFRMGTEMRAYFLEKPVLGFGGNFTFAL
ncbi:MAG: hypothetical protein EB078_12760 [Proteobacteria bacterium]|nr:hypothetical protein [Pseudomonadota bacterium]NDC25952.1 hypothetical protein [Pseudomonadota bacterium]NDD05768.1 hypothetical protein [Pseudomonadota bacterium]NDG28265.1 hypothetical protein [Pseudomonadota bacterium]